MEIPLKLLIPLQLQSDCRAEIDDLRLRIAERGAKCVPKAPARKRA